MSDEALRKDIQSALRRFAEPRLAQPTRELLAALGYRSTKFLRGDPHTIAAFLQNFQLQGLNAQRAMLDDWRSVEVVFQLTGQDLLSGGQLSMFSSDQVDNTIIESYLFVAVDLKPREGGYTRSELAGITREINRGMTMPVLMIFRHDTALTFAVIDRRLHKLDDSRDVLEKVTLIKDIRFASPHRAHLEILADLALQHLIQRDNVHNFVELHRAWRRSLDSSELNKRFFRELANWYFWAVRTVEFPADVQPERDLRNATSVIRLITRLMFVWFLKEKGLVPDALFEQRDLRGLLTSLADNESTFYKAILQNLFFATLNTEMNDPKTPRRFRSKNSSGGRDAHYLIPNVYRYEQLFRDPPAALALFKDIPFLNGGLFECQDRLREEGAVERVDGFSDHPKNPLHVPNELFFSREREVDLNAIYDTRGRTYKVRGLIDILSSYKFTIAENTPIEEEVALDPELLGQVFENLLANYNPETRTTARKQTGSFYTPREIVNYMVDESLLAYLEQHLASASRLIAGVEARPDESVRERLQHLLAYTNEPPHFNEAETRALIMAIDSLTILDPAAGSGAFPMGILHKLVHILSRLDPGNRRWKQQQIDRAQSIPDAVAREAAIESIEEAFERNELDYGRKLFLIENCIYGVDIQPIAVQIAKLRCFIALIVDEKIDDTRANRGIRPLPNLETKFVAANTLIGIQRSGQQRLRDSDIEDKEQELKVVRSRHFNARTPQTKARWRQRDGELRKELGVLLQRDGFSGDTAAMLASWDPYDQNTSAPFFDPEWMFGVDEGFDIVIANPPYIRIQELTASSPAFAAHLKKEYVAASKGNYDIYVVFVEHGLWMLNRTGNLAFILPHKFFNTQYGEPLRGLIAKGKHLRKIVHFGDSQVFNSATTYTCLLFLAKSHQESLDFVQVNNAQQWQDNGTASIASIPLSKVTSTEWNFTTGKDAALFERLANIPTKLGDIADKIFQGLVTSADPIYLLNPISEEKEGAITVQSSNEEIHHLETAITKPLCKGSRDIHRYYATPSKRVIFPYFTHPSRERGNSALIPPKQFSRLYPRTWAYLENNRKILSGREKGKMQHEGWYGYVYPKSISLFAQKKILTPSIAERASYTLDAKGELYFVGSGGGGGGGYGILLKDDCRLSYEFVLGLLNSKLLDYYLRNISSRFQGGYYAYNRQYIEKLPIMMIDFSNMQEQKVHTRINEIVTQILAAKQRDPATDVTALEAEIDAHVYRLYGLTEDEIAVVEESVRR